MVKRGRSLLRVVGGSSWSLVVGKDSLESRVVGRDCGRLMKVRGSQRWLAGTTGGYD